MQFIVTVSRSYAINDLPGPVYIVVSNLSIVWNFVLSKFLLKAEFNRWHYLSVVFTLAAAGVASQYHSRPENNLHHSKTYEGPRQRTLGLVACIVYSFLTAATSVVSKRVLKSAGANKKNPVCVSEISFANSFIPCVISIPIVAVLGQTTSYQTTYNHVMAIDGQTVVFFIFLTLAVAKMVDRMSKFSLVGLKSAFYYQVLNAAISGGQAIIAILVFKDLLTPDIFISLFLLVVALAFTIKGDMQDSENEKNDKLKGMKQALIEDPEDGVQMAELAHDKK
jgi:membrane protease YdiL (CAAX protease family)